jgi:hypothetical protein
VKAKGLKRQLQHRGNRNIKRRSYKVLRDVSAYSNDAFIAGTLAGIHSAHRPYIWKSESVR